MKLTFISDECSERLCPSGWDALLYVCVVQLQRSDSTAKGYAFFFLSYLYNNVFLTFFICPSPRTHGEVERHTTQPPSSHEHTPLFLLEAAVATAVSGAAMAVTEAAVAVTWVALVVVRSKCRTPVLSGRQAYPYRPRG